MWLTMSYVKLKLTYPIIICSKIGYILYSFIVKETVLSHDILFSQYATVVLTRDVQLDILHILFTFIWKMKTF